ncbi:hypothetical protein SODALDRAFT_330105 [Sodiomyces alkalinus F11]|uniref:Uncharacterized protein n=1 Tax=Sodiomyces alkalinus (strain CBS 110278 / VKM F-3762 / F11) TaxID=1314773 RepID=A0A3N2Q0Z8_SODAK|nr:hypothetical protein SODALDRAFT_330105 [Sodiomyces alkalinus F11]ROT40386.1 hypothetical protein SODALDRAFT_330105 [Sodiomyces alkalinus F11]
MSPCNTPPWIAISVRKTLRQAVSFPSLSFCLSFIAGDVPIRSVWAISRSRLSWFHINASDMNTQFRSDNFRQVCCLSNQPSIQRPSQSRVIAEPPGQTSKTKPMGWPSPLYLLLVSALVQQTPTTSCSAKVGFWDVTSAQGQFALASAGYDVE